MGGVSFVNEHCGKRISIAGRFQKALRIIPPCSISFCIIPIVPAGSPEADSNPTTSRWNPFTAT